MDGGAPAYRAFISYSHADAAFGMRLHRLLETYRLPQRLVGRPTPAGPAPPRLSPIFRDREELAATGDLSAEVRAALARSGALVVVCSPTAARSTWVSREVELFRKLHPNRPILAALAEGDPAEAFPAALRSADGTEPLAGDFRDHKDGPRLALLKLVAGMLGMGLDELIQRDAQRRLQRVTAVTVTAVAAMLVMAGMTSVALTARAEAQRQRAEAEGLVEFMLTDLRDRLKGVGRLDVLTAANQRALAYYGDQDLNRLPPDSLGRRARILHAMGEDDELRGDLPAALREFQEARRTTAALLAAAPNDPQRIFDHAQSEYWVALIDWRSDRLPAAEAGFRRYADLATRLLTIDPQKPEWLMEAGYTQSNLGMIALRDMGRPDLAESRFRQALKYQQAAGRTKPADSDTQKEIADTYGWLASAQRVSRRFEDARASRGEEARIVDGLAAADPDSRAYDRARLANVLGLAVIDLDDGRPKAAVARLRPAYEEAGRLAAVDPKAAWRTKQRLAIGLTLAKALLLSGAAPADVAPYVSPCFPPPPGSDPELRDICAVTEARLAAARGDAKPAQAYLRDNAARLSDGRLSPRWGLNFRAELENIIHSKESDHGSVSNLR
jgi:tetratricopeptide (TPR) repeat protein